MKGKINLVSVIIVVLFIGIMVVGGSKKADAQEAKTEKAERKDNGQYPIGSKIKIYDGNLKPIDAYLAYDPSYTYKKTYISYDNDKVVVLNWVRGLSHEAFILTKEEGIGFFRNSIDKSIEWAATAKKNNVHSFKKEIPTPDGYEHNTYIITSQIVGNPPTYSEPVGLLFTFCIMDFHGKEETLLIMCIYDVYGTQLQRVFCFREDDFALLKEIFSVSYLAELDKKEEAWQELRRKQDALFK